MYKVLDIYIKRPIIWDFLIVMTIWISSKYLGIFQFTYLDSNSQVNLLSNIIGTSVSLSGFILAALTIIVTFKSNIKAKGMNEASDALELIFSSKHYPSIVKVFKSAIFEYCILFVLLYLAWICSANFNKETLNRINLCGIFVSGVIIFRSLFTLFKVTDLSNSKI